jgi:MFS family permease
MFSQLNKNDKRNYLLLMIGASFHFGSLAFMFLLPRFILHIGGNESDMGFIFGIAIIPALLVSPFAGYLSDKMSGKLLALTGTSIAILSTLSFLFVNDLSALIYILRILQTGGHAMFFAVVFGLLAHIIPERNRAEGIAYFAVAVQFGQSGGTLLAEQIIAHWGFNFYFIGSFIIGLVAISMVSLVKIASNEADAVLTATQAQPANKESYLSAICRKEYIGGFILIFILGGGFGSVLQFITPYLDYLQKAALTIRKIPTAYFIPPALITVALSRLFLSRITDRVGRNKVIFTIFPIFILTIFLITFIRSGYTALAVAIMFGLAYGFLFPALNAVVLSRAEVRHRGKVSGILVMLFDSAFFGFAFICGPLAYRIGYFNMYYILAFIMLAGFLIYIFFEKILKKTALPI